MKKTKMEKGITLIALIITIVVLLILAAVAIAAIQNENILSHANNAAVKYNSAVQNEQDTLGGYLNFLNNQGGQGNQGGSGYEQVTLAQAISPDMLTRTENSQTTDIYGNTIKIPAGFKILVDSTTGYTGTTDIAVEKGIVITDGTNEFVYVPVGQVKTASETKTITLARYEFDITFNTSTMALEGTGAVTEEGTHTSATDQLTDPFMTVMAPMMQTENPVFIEGKIDGIAEDEEGNDTKGYALDISDFYSKASSGYYIGRYEARTTNNTERTSESTLTDVTLNKENAVYNYITQIDATSKCQSMYTNKPFTTDLVNSFAWDTAIAFIQEIGVDADYSKQTSVNPSFSKTGTVGLETEDKVCNIYDMASNCGEWSTETSSYADFPCTYRGGIYGNSSSYASLRGIIVSVGGSDAGSSFRPVLYL